jgi:glycosyltransferase involved in cell wall biosynthesis
MVGWGHPSEKVGGLGVYTKELAEAFERSPVDLELLLPADVSPEDASVIESEPADDPEKRAVKLGERAAEEADRFDIVHTNDWMGVPAGLRASRKGCSWVSATHSVPGHYPQYEKAAVELPDAAVCVSNLLADKVDERFGTRPGVIHNAFNHIEPGVDGGRMDDDKVTVFYAGRHSTEKELKLAVYGFKLYSQEQEAEFVVAGEGWMTPQLKQLVDRLDIAEKVVFTGFLLDGELAHLYSNADVFLHPAQNEPFGLSITEALSSGTPVVAGRSGCLELSSEGVVEVEAKAQEIGNGILAAQQKEFDGYRPRAWSDVADDLTNIYTELI